MTEPVAAERDVVERARTIADEILFPQALDTDRAVLLPVRLLDVLAADGLYGLVGPRELGGLAIDEATRGAVVEALAGGCLTTTFVWAQHHSAVAAVDRSEPVVRGEWLEALCRGARRAGVAFGGLRRAGAPLLTADRSSGGWMLNGSAPWVSGWGRIDVVLVAAWAGSGEIVWLLVDTAESSTLTVEHVELAAVAASGTVRLRFAGHFVPKQRVTIIEGFEEWIVRDAGGLRANGALALGVAGRCAGLVGSDRLVREVDETRERLATAPPNEVPAVRAAAAALAQRAATELVVRSGGRAILLGDHAQRLGREAMFLQVFGQTASIRRAQLALAIDDRSQ